MPPCPRFPTPVNILASGADVENRYNIYNKRRTSIYCLAQSTHNTKTTSKLMKAQLVTVIPL